MRLHHLAVLAALALPAPLPAQTAVPSDYWPREIRTKDSSVITIFQPQIEKFVGIQVTARSAMSIKLVTRKDPVFGAVWFTANVDTDHEAGTVNIRDIRVANSRFPESTPELTRRFAEIVNADFPEAGMTMALERFSASLATAERERRSAEGLRNDPPKIVFSAERSILLLFDGPPQARALDDYGYQRIVNTPFAVVRDKNGAWWLNGGKYWYSATDPQGPWVPGRPPREITEIMPRDTSSAPAPKLPPRIIVATEPTELIASDGPPQWTPVVGGKLLYVKNAEAVWIREVASQDNYLLLSGRWFRSADTTGPWTFVRPDSLPLAFKDIPAESDLGRVRVSVAGTQEAEDALLDMAVPQTAAIKRSEARLEVQYDGVPRFKPIEGTQVEHAINTPTPVLRIDGLYYAVDQAVWFVAADAKGPWAVADSIPREAIQRIPPSAPVYNVTDVEIFGSTPDVVYVGYYPGYVGSYPWYGVPVYGTGWYYPPLGPVYYPHPVTYGMAFSYSPYAGWGVGFSWSMGFLSIGIGFHPWPPSYGGFYPPYGYRPPFYGGGYPGRPGGPGVGTRPRPTPYASNNMYLRGSNAGRVSAQPATRPGAGVGGARPSQMPNNVYAAPNGDVFRNSGGGWESRGASGWDKAGGSRAPSSLTRDMRARQSGAARAAPRGGGGRRR
ncbi:MAG TPA: hypothetical protein VF862_03980 [Gemmatimonadales bacterium]